MEYRWLFSLLIFIGLCIMAINHDSEQKKSKKKIEEQRDEIHDLEHKLTVQKLEDEIKELKNKD